MSLSEGMPLPSLSEGMPLPLVWAVLFVLAGVVIAVGWRLNYAPEDDSRFERMKAVRAAFLSNGPSAGLILAGLICMGMLTFTWGWGPVLVCSNWTLQADWCPYEDIDVIWHVGITCALLSLVSGVWFLFSPWMVE